MPTWEQITSTCFAVSFGIFVLVGIWKIGIFLAPKMAALFEGHLNFMRTMSDNQVKQTLLEERQIEMLTSVDTKVVKVQEVQEEHGKRLWRIENNQKPGTAGG